MHGFSTTDHHWYLEADRTFELGPRGKGLADSGTQMRFFYVQFAALLIPPALDLLWRESLVALPGNARLKTVGKTQSCMVSQLQITGRRHPR